ncbi:MAG: hypothetical protein GXW99_07155 [Clostridiales bacterium]|nr:hypothetical protein [Clostridiales bacterium]
MGGTELAVSINALAVTLAKCLTEEELEITAAMFTQIGDTLATIAIRRAACSEKEAQLL